MAIVVFEHSDVLGPGRLGATFRDHGYRLDVRRLEAGGTVPVDLNGVQGLVSLGGPQRLTGGGQGKYPWLEEEAAYLRMAHQADLPVIGIGLGAQLIAHALGGRVEPLDRPRAGFRIVSLNPTGQVEAVLAGIPWDCPQLCLRQDEVVELPAGAVALGSSDGCAAEVFRVGLRTFAFQHHFECDRMQVDEVAQRFSRLLSEAGLSREDLARQAEAGYERYARTGDRLCVNLLTYAFPFVERMSA
jgi:GMP synthase (glutamine-hydrolysing)